MRKVTKSYLLNLSEVERAFVEEMAWRNRKKLSEYFRLIVNTEMQKHPDVVKLVIGRLQKNEGLQERGQDD